MRTSIVLIFALALSCATPGPREPEIVVPGTTRADSTLKNDTVYNLMIQQNVKLLQKGQKDPCRDHSVIEAKNISGPEPSPTDRRQWSNWNERWTMKSCGLIGIYNIQFAPDGQGGTFIMIRPEP